MSTIYKKRERSERVLVDTPAPINGIHNTNQEVPSGYAKLMINYNLNKDYTGLVPREGYATKPNTDIVVEDNAIDTAVGCTQFVGQLYVEEQDTEDTYLTGVMLSFGRGEPTLLGVNPTNPVNLTEATDQRLDLAVWTNAKLTEVEE